MEILLLLPFDNFSHSLGKAKYHGQKFLNIILKKNEEPASL